MSDFNAILPMKTWEILNTARKMPAIGTQWLLKLLNIDSERQLQRLCADPKAAESAAPNLIDKYERLLGRLMELGRENVARASVMRQVRIVECEMRCNIDTKPDKNTLAEECLDDLPGVVNYHRVLVDPESTDEMVDLALMLAVKELEQNRVARKIERGKVGC